MINKDKAKAISNFTRLKIIKLIDNAEECNVGKLQSKLKISQSSLSQHLAILRSSGLLKHRRCGQQIFYSLNDPKSLTVAEILLNW